MPATSASPTSARTPVRAAAALALLLLVMLLPQPTAPASAQGADDPIDVLVWTGTYGFRHPSITDAQMAVLQLANAEGFNATLTENPASLTAATLRGFDVLMWISTTGKPPLTAEQRDDVIRFAGCGGGNIGFHATLDSNYGWQDHAELWGAQFDSHPQNAGDGEATMQVEDRESPMTEGWHDVESFPFDDEYYRWRGAKAVEGVSLPREYGDTSVLLSLDETSVREGIQEGPLAYEDDQPISWTKTFRDRGRVFYNNMGHSSSTWSLPEFRTSVVNAVRWAAEVPLDLECYDGDAELPPSTTQVPDADPELAGTSCTLPDILPRDGGFTWERSGPAKALTAEGDTLELGAGVPGNLQWGAQTYILDLAGTGAASADVTFTLQIPNPADDYDLSVTTAWGHYGATSPSGASEEVIVIEDVPNCAYLHVAGDNMIATGQAAPTLVSSFETDPIVPLRIDADAQSPAAIAGGWAAARPAPECACALLARNDDFADALSSGAAQAGGAVLLLTDTDELSAQAAQAIEERGISTVTVLGGPQAVSEAVVEQVEALGATTARVSGATRISTAIAIATAFAGDLPATPLIVRAYGVEGDPTAAFADALAAGRIAARGGHPILLTGSGGLSDEVAQHLTDVEATEVVVVGGEQAVGPQVVADLEDLGITVTRVGGQERAETAVLLAQEVAGAADARAAGGVLLVDARAATTWADGFAAAGWPGDGLVVLSDGDGLPQPTAGWLGAGEGLVPLVCGAATTQAACDAVAADLGYTTATGGGQAGSTG